MKRGDVAWSILLTGFVAFVATAAYIMAFTEPEDSADCEPGPQYEYMRASSFPKFESEHHVYNFTMGDNRVLAYYMEECDE